MGSQCLVGRDSCPRLSAEFTFLDPGEGPERPWTEPCCPACLREQTGGGPGFPLSGSVSLSRAFDNMVTSMMIQVC